MHMVAGEARTIEMRLSKGDWIVGEKPGAADYMIYPGIKLLLRALARPEARDLVFTLPAGRSELSRARALAASASKRLPGYERTYPPHWRVAL